MYPATSSEISAISDITNPNGTPAALARSFANNCAFNAVSSVAPCINIILAKPLAVVSAPTPAPLENLII